MDAHELITLDQKEGQMLLNRKRRMNELANRSRMRMHSWVSKVQRTQDIDGKDAIDGK